MFSDDGEYALITLDEGEYPDTLERGVRVLLFTSDGEELWRFNTEENRGRGVISNLGSYVIIPCLDWPYRYPYKKSTYLLSKEGELIKKYDNLLANITCISSNEKYAILKDHTELLTLIDLGRGGEAIFTYSLLGRPQQISSVDIAEDARMFGLISHYATLRKLSPEIEQKEKNIEVLLIDFYGGKVWSKTFPFEGGPQYLRLSDDGKQMILQVGSKIMIYHQVE